MKEPETEKPKRAAAVMATLTAVTSPGPKRRVTRSLARAEMTVQADIIMDIIPAKETGTPSWGYMLGQAEPSRESGRPRLIKARYMKASRILTTVNTSHEN